MFEIIVNGKSLQLLSPIPSEITSLAINYRHGIPIPIHRQYKKPIQEWLYRLTQSVDEILVVNKTILTKEQVTKL